MWSDELMGSTNSAGTLDSGMFAYWQAHLVTVLLALMRDHCDSISSIAGPHHTACDGSVAILKSD